MRRQMVINTLNRHQGGKCGFCHDPVITPVIDHDHETGIVRGLLCGGCNSAEGRAQTDHPEWMVYRVNTPAMAIGMSVNYWTL